MPLTGIFGDAAVELAGIIIDPSCQGRRLGSRLVSELVQQRQSSRLIAYTRNPSLLRLLENVSGHDNVLKHENPKAVAATIANATTGVDNHLYHIGRYAPNGLYGAGHDPAARAYHGVPLLEQCVLLADPTNALAVSVTIQKEQV